MITAALLAALLLAQAGTPAPAPTPAPPPDSAKARPQPVADSFRPDPAWKPLGQDLWFDPTARRVAFRARVCLTDGILEHLVCSKNSKEHESILATEAPPKLIHAGLLLAGATPGHPVRFEPKFEPPAGPEIDITVEWDRDGVKQQSDARRWVKETATGAALARDWVFAGSLLYPDRRTKQQVYAADDGDLITVANFASSILDLPYRSSANDADRSYSANPDLVPPRGTAVTVYLAPRAPVPGAPQPR